MTRTRGVTLSPRPDAPPRRSPRRYAVWLAYVPVVFLEPALSRAPLTEWMVLGVALAAFLAAFLAATREVRGGLYAFIAVSVALGAFLAPANLGAVVFFSYAAGACSYLQRHAHAVASIIAISALGAIEALTRHQIMLLPLGGLLPSFVGILFLYLESYRRTNERLRAASAEIERLAGIAERERIARDLHDVLGHTLSLIAVKSDLAARLAEKSAPQAAAECRDVQAASRTALSEIRQVVRGYRAGLVAEIGAARALLEAAGIDATISAPTFELPRETEEVFAFVLREGVTNVVRHARATTCRVMFGREGDRHVLAITDDGRGLGAGEGSGVRGMRERVALVDGALELSSKDGTKLMVSITSGRTTEGAS